MINSILCKPSTARKFLFTAALSVSVFFSLQAQDYKSAIGLRFGYYGNFGLDYKTFLDDKAAIELMAFGRFYTSYKYFDLGGLYEIQNKFSDVPGLSWYYGGGAFVGIFSYDGNFPGSQSTSIRIAGVLGLEYRIPGAPITASIDWIPSIALTGGGDTFVGNGGSLAVRYIFK